MTLPDLEDFGVLIDNYSNTLTSLNISFVGKAKTVEPTKLPKLLRLRSLTIGNGYFIETDFVHLVKQYPNIEIANLHTCELPENTMEIIEENWKLIKDLNLPYLLPYGEIVAQTNIGSCPIEVLILQVFRMLPSLRKFRNHCYGWFCLHEYSIPVTHAIKHYKHVQMVD